MSGAPNGQSGQDGQDDQDNQDDQNSPSRAERWKGKIKNSRVGRKASEIKNSKIAQGTSAVVRSKARQFKESKPIRRAVGRVGSALGGAAVTGLGLGISAIGATAAGSPQAMVTGAAASVGVGRAVDNSLKGKSKLDKEIVDTFRRGYER